MKKRSGFQVMARLIKLVKPLTGFMLLAILMGLVGHLCAAFITIFGGYAVLEATDEEIEAACKKASVHDFIMTLPRGYDTPVGELGNTLSGGERQRLGLARAFLHDAPLLLLDEPTSNLDSLNEAVILKSLHEEREGKTVVLVSHRQSTMRIADTVYSVEHGRMS